MDPIVAPVAEQNCRGGGAGLFDMTAIESRLQKNAKQKHVDAFEECVEHAAKNNLEDVLMKENSAEELEGLHEEGTHRMKPCLRGGATAAPEDELPKERMRKRKVFEKVDSRKCVTPPDNDANRRKRRNIKICELKGMSVYRTIAYVTSWIIVVCCASIERE